MGVSTEAQRAHAKLRLPTHQSPELTDQTTVLPLKLHLHNFSDQAPCRCSDGSGYTAVERTDANHVLSVGVRSSWDCRDSLPPRSSSVGARPHAMRRCHGNQMQPAIPVIGLLRAYSTAHCGTQSSRS
uniref:Uncharacterized protein n=1 Tax=Knipowitschia caucasica TaxID=637954 RepID=A0AAV2ISV3_KNICA